MQLGLPSIIFKYIDRVAALDDSIWCLIEKENAWLYLSVYFSFKSYAKTASLTEILYKILYRILSL